MMDSLKQFDVLNRRKRIDKEYERRQQVSVKAHAGGSKWIERRE